MHPQVLDNAGSHIRRRSRRRRGFTLIEMLMALTISASLMAATLVAFDGMYKIYDTSTTSASNHVVARIAVSRLLGMMRTGSDFGPFPADVLNSDVNPLKADYFEFASQTNAQTGAIEQITRVEFRLPGQDAPLRTWGANDDPPLIDSDADGEGDTMGPGELWVIVIDPSSGDEQEFLMLSDVRSVAFELEYDIGPRLVKGTIDITFEPTLASDNTVWTPATPESVRLVASAMPRRSVDR
ncbi:MAG: prepilin-type N-terminal cleavage/methylation domain-containing protein [Phycisphaerales bacterium]|nr:prepilin-type N-terminal cleavage/methylation domain-containing protein [Phycisphaerales bacterium]